MRRETRQFAEENGLRDYVDYFERGGVLNLNANAFREQGASGIEVDAVERQALDLEDNPKHRFDKFRQTAGLYFLVGLCSAAAAGRKALCLRS